jgi:hypothetical protein
MRRDSRRGRAVAVQSLSLALAALVGVVVLSTGAFSGTAGASSAPKPDTHWSALGSCLKSSARPLRNNVVFNAPGSVRVYQAPPEGFFLAGITYDGTFARAEAQAKRMKRVTKGVAPIKRTGGGLAIGNVSFFFTFAVSTPDVEAIAKCLGKTYPRAPKWPASLKLSSLATGPPWPSGS